MINPPETLGAVVCGGNDGIVVTGEGVIGFPRESLIAGVETVWTTLWKVRPEDAAPFAIRMLREYVNEGRPIADNLWKAQNFVLTRSGDDRVHPRFWAGWVVIGHHDLTTELPSLGAMKAEPLQKASLPSPALTIPGGKEAKARGWAAAGVVVVLVALVVLGVVLIKRRQRGNG